MHLSLLRYANDGTTQALHVLQPDVPLPGALNPAGNDRSHAITPYDLQMSVANFDGQGRDEIALAFTRIGFVYTQHGAIPNAAAQLNVLGFDQQLAWQRFGQTFLTGPGCQNFSQCLPTASPRLAAGLFHYDETKGFTLGRRQIALSWMNPSNRQTGNQASLQLFDVALSQPDCAVNCALQFAGLATTPLVISQAPFDQQPAAPTIALASGVCRSAAPPHHPPGEWRRPWPTPAAPAWPTCAWRAPR